MANNTGTVVADAIVPLGSNPTHYDSNGQGGWSSTGIYDNLENITVNDSLDTDGLGSGHRKAGMAVWVISQSKAYVLDIPGFMLMNDNDRYLALQNNDYWSELKSDVDKAYVDAIKAILEGSITTQKERIDAILLDAPEALDTFKEIVAQILADESGAAAILATLNQHTTALATKVDKVTGKQLSTEDYTTSEKNKLAGLPSSVQNLVVEQNLGSNSTTSVPSVKAVNEVTINLQDGIYYGLLDKANDIDVVHKSGNESIAGNKTFANDVKIQGSYPGAGANILTHGDIVIDSGGNLFFGTYSYGGGTYLGRHYGTNNQNFTIVTNGNGSASFAADGKVGFGIDEPTEQIDVSGNVKANKFIGDGSMLTNLPSTGTSISNTDTLTEGSTNKYFTQARVISSPLTGLTSTTGTPTATDTIVTAWGKVLNFMNTLSAQVRTVVLSGYLKATTTTSIADGDTYAVAIGKLEKKADDTTTNIGTLTSLTTSVKTSIVNAINSLVTTLNGKANLASPNFSGYPSAPTQIPDTYGSYLATLDYVQQSFSGTATKQLAVSYDGTIVTNSGASNQFNSTGGKGVIIQTRPLITVQAFFGGSSDVDLNGFRYECIAYGFHLYGGGKIFRNGTILGNIVARGGANTSPIEITGGCIMGQFETAGDTYNPIYILDNVRVYPRQAGQLPANKDNAPCKFIMRNGAQFVGCTPGSNAVVVYEATGVINRSTTTVTFDTNAEYNPVSTGTFTVDNTKNAIGAVVVAYLGSSATQPTIPTTGYKLISGAYEAGKNLMYMFKVGANNQIQYTISNVD